MRRFATVLAGMCLLLAIPTVPAALAVPSAETWGAELAVDGGDDVDVVADDGAARLRDTAARTTTTGPAPAEGTLLLAPRRLGAVADRISTAPTADTPGGSQVLVAVRGIRDDGSWSEWIPTGAQGPAQLPAPTLQVQVRVTLVAGTDGASPALRRLWLTADSTPAPRRLSASAATPPFTARVFATRIGLVGNTTANGHRIVSDDRFVALPSRRGLAADGTGDYTVKVCAGGRCAWAPVWDVGPWNTKDDHWNADRESFTDLARGLPQAQAARDDGYNGGRDGFGRRVANPAGIDLADGTFRRDLRLTDNGYVDVTYLWTGTGPAGTARGDDPVTVRAAPSPDAPDVGVVAARSRVGVECAAAPTASSPAPTPAPSARAAARTTTSAPVTSRWLRLGTGQYVPATALEVPDVPAC
ncbi:hypothetical protein [Actinomycetospora soli]|uniref:hypothetical protein n=1 Tax=Actinomycetospora soli TaxID=2893887 RepID=UPI001E37C43A|nr:hypothetical protein [Actinomycetospora soli]MCD2191201.1 hypothetical protein [Actinomycetospora soli]